MTSKPGCDAPIEHASLSSFCRLLDPVFVVDLFGVRVEVMSCDRELPKEMSLQSGGGIETWYPISWLISK